MMVNNLSAVSSVGCMMDNTTPCDDNSLLLTPSQMSCDLFTFVAYVGVLGVMSVFGLIGNTLSFFVLSWERHSHVATFLLQVMACADNLFLLTTAFSQISQAIQDYIFQRLHHAFMAYVVVLVWPLVHITQMWTVWITVLVAFNRFVAICYPFSATQWCTMRQARVQVVCISTLIVLYNTPRFFEYHIVYDETTNSTIANTTKLQENRIYNIVYENFLYFLFVFFGPLLLLTYLNSRLILEMCRARVRLLARQLPASLNHEDPEQNLTRVMIVIVVIFLVCQTPAFINQILSLVISYDCELPYFYFYHISNLLVSANSSLNFVVYCVFRQQFRQRLRSFCTQSRYDYNNSLQYSATGDNVPLRNPSSRSTSIQMSGGSNAGHNSRSTSVQVGSGGAR